MSKKKINPDEKKTAVQKYLKGEYSQTHIENTFGLSQAAIQQWIRNYKSMGTDAFTMISYKKY